MGQFMDLAAANPVFFLGEHDNAASFGRFVGQRRELGCVSQLCFGDARGGNEFRRGSVAQSDGAGFIQQQNVHVAGCFDRLTAHGQHVVLHHSVDAGDADG